MGCCWVTSCCGCLSLEKGARAIATGEMVLSVLGLVGSIVQLDITRIVGGALGILISCLLLYGVRAKKRGVVLAWLVLDALELIAMVIVMVFAIMLATSAHELQVTPDNPYDEDISEDEQEAVATMSWILFAVTAGFLALFLYFWIVVFSYYQELKTARHPGDPEGARRNVDNITSQPPTYEMINKDEREQLAALSP